MKPYLHQLPSFLIRTMVLCFDWANHLKRGAEVMSPPTVLRCTSLLVAICTCLVVLLATSHAQQKDTPKQTPPIPKLATTVQEPLPVYPGSQFRREFVVTRPNVRVKRFRGEFVVTGPDASVNVALDEYVTTEAPEKVIAFYRKELAAQGTEIECRSMRMFTSGKFSRGCKGDSGVLQLKLTGKGLPYVVAIKPSRGATIFALIFVFQLSGSAVPPKLSTLEDLFNDVFLFSGLVPPVGTTRRYGYQGGSSSTSGPLSNSSDNDEPHPQHPGGFSFADPGAPPAGSREPPGPKDP